MKRPILYTFAVSFMLASANLDCLLADTDQYFVCTTHNPRHIACSKKEIDELCSGKNPCKRPFVPYSALASSLETDAFFGLSAPKADASKVASIVFRQNKDKSALSESPYLITKETFKKNGLTEYVEFMSESNDRLLSVARSKNGLPKQIDMFSGINDRSCAILPSFKGGTLKALKYVDKSEAAFTTTVDSKAGEDGAILFKLREGTKIIYSMKVQNIRGKYVPVEVGYHNKSEKPTILEKYKYNDQLLKTKIDVVMNGKVASQIDLKYSKFDKSRNWLERTAFRKKEGDGNAKVLVEKTIRSIKYDTTW